MYFHICVYKGWRSVYWREWWFSSCCMPRICHSLCVVHEAKLRGKTLELWDCVTLLLQPCCHWMQVDFSCFFFLFSSVSLLQPHHSRLNFNLWLNGKNRVFQWCSKKRKKRERWFSFSSPGRAPKSRWKLFTYFPFAACILHTYIINIGRLMPFTHQTV